MPGGMQIGVRPRRQPDPLIPAHKLNLISAAGLDRDSDFIPISYHFCSTPVDVPRIFGKDLSTLLYHLSTLLSGRLRLGLRPRFEEGRTYEESVA
jgi:hypothetical protein